jgi:hypothetical protein
MAPGRGLCSGVLALTLFAPGAGCGGAKRVPVEGVVTLDGKPVEGAAVTFMPEGDKGTTAVGQTEAGGVFRLIDGAWPGSYKVLVTKTEDTALARLKAEAPDPAAAEREYYKTLRTSPPMRSLLPAVYGDSAQTPLRWAVPGDGKKTLDLRSTGRP